MTEPQGPPADTLKQIRRRRRRGTTLKALGVLTLIAAGIGGYIYYFDRDLEQIRELLPFTSDDEAGPSFGGRESAGGPGDAASETPEAATDETIDPKEILAAEEIELPALGESDAAAREHAARITDHAQVEKWLASDELVRRFTVVVQNVADGKSPRFHLRFLIPKRTFGAVPRAGRLYADPKSYARYDLVANVFSSIDAANAVRVYRSFQPLVTEASGELGNRDADFDSTLSRAIRELLSTPVVEGPVEVQLDVLTYAYHNPALEDLDAVQKLFLRMGPDNVRKVQRKLREIAKALGIPDKDLPRARTARGV